MDTGQRVARVERQIRIFKGICTLVGLAVAALIVHGANEPILEVIRARRFEVVLPNGGGVS